MLWKRGFMIRGKGGGICRGGCYVTLPHCIYVSLACLCLLLSSCIIIVFEIVVNKQSVFCFNIVNGNSLRIVLVALVRTIVALGPSDINKLSFAHQVLNSGGPFPPLQRF